MNKITESQIEEFAIELLESNSIKFGFGTVKGIAID